MQPQLQEQDTLKKIQESQQDTPPQMGGNTSPIAPTPAIPANPPKDAWEWMDRQLDQPEPNPQDLPIEAITPEMVTTQPEEDLDWLDAIAAKSNHFIQKAQAKALADAARKQGLAKIKEISDKLFADLERHGLQKLMIEGVVARIERQKFSDANLYNYGDSKIDAIFKECVIALGTDRPLTFIDEKSSIPSSTRFLKAIPARGTLEQDISKEDYWYSKGLMGSGLYCIYALHNSGSNDKLKELTHNLMGDEDNYHDVTLLPLRAVRIITQYDLRNLIYLVTLSIKTAMDDITTYTKEIDTQAVKSFKIELGIFQSQLKTLEACFLDPGRAALLFGYHCIQIPSEDILVQTQENNYRGLGIMVIVNRNQTVIKQSTSINTKLL